MWKGKEQKQLSGLTTATRPKVRRLLTLISNSRPSSPMWCTPLTPPGWGWRASFNLRSCVTSLRSHSTKSLPRLPPAQSKPRARTCNQLNTGLAQKESNQCLAIYSKVGLAKFILPRLSKLWPPWGITSCLARGVRAPRKGKRDP
jgi:hypothetical protein